MTTPDDNAPGEASTEEPAAAKKSIWPTIIKIVVVVGVIFGLTKLLPVKEWMDNANAWIESLGVWGPIAFIAIYAIAAVFFIPGSALTVGAGTLFGVVWGSIYVSAGSTLGAVLAFLVGRHLARKKIEKRIEGNERFAAIDSAVAKEGWKIVGLTRLSPVFPFTLLNYAYGITKVKFSHYLIASWIGMMPGTVLYVYIGSLGKAASEGKTPLQWALYAVGLLATLAVTIYVTKVAKAALNEKIED